MMLVERLGYRIDSHTIRGALDRVSCSYRRREHKPLHPCNLLYWFLFVSNRGVVLVLVVLVMTKLSSLKTVVICVFYCGFGFCRFIRAEDFYLPILFKISIACLPFSKVAFVVLFPTSARLSKTEIGRAHV